MKGQYMSHAHTLSPEVYQHKPALHEGVLPNSAKFLFHQKNDERRVFDNGLQELLKSVEDHREYMYRFFHLAAVYTIMEHERCASVTLSGIISRTNTTLVCLRMNGMVQYETSDKPRAAT